MAVTRLSSKGQVIIPKEIRAARDWKPGLELSVEQTRDGGILLKPLRPPKGVAGARELIGCTGYSGPRRSLREMDAAIAREARRR